MTTIEFEKYKLRNKVLKLVPLLRSLVVPMSASWWPKRSDSWSQSYTRSGSWTRPSQWRGGSEQSGSVWRSDSDWRRPGVAVSAASASDDWAQREYDRANMRDMTEQQLEDAGLTEQQPEDAGLATTTTTSKQRRRAEKTRSCRLG